MERQQLLPGLRLVGQPRADKGPQAATAKAADESAAPVDESIAVEGRQKAAVAQVFPAWPGKWPHAPKAMVFGSPLFPSGGKMLLGSLGTFLFCVILSLSSLITLVTAGPGP